MEYYNAVNETKIQKRDSRRSYQEINRRMARPERIQVGYGRDSTIERQTDRESTERAGRYQT